MTKQDMTIEQMAASYKDKHGDNLLHRGILLLIKQGKVRYLPEIDAIELTQREQSE